MTKVDVQFRALGTDIPADHGYHLFSAISALIPQLHGDDEIGIHSISGRLVGNRRLALTDHSRLTIRLCSERIAEILPLAGRSLCLADSQLRIGTPQTHALVPASRLYSRLVIVKGFLDHDPFLDAARRQLAELDIRAESSLVPQPHLAAANADRPTGTRSPFLRRTLRIRDKEVVGFAVRVEGLTAEESIRLQEAGLGGRRRFGCGVFVPDNTTEQP